MKRLLLIIPLVLILISGCGKKESGIKLEKGTPAYQLAKEISEKVVYLDPDKNNVLASTKNFTLTAGEAIDKVHNGSGNNVERLKSMSKEDMSRYFDRFIQQFAERKLLLNAAEKANISFSQAEIDSVLKLRYQRSGGEEKFRTQLESKNIDLEFIKNDIIQTATISKYFEQTLSDSAKVTEEEILARYNRAKTATVRHILLKTTGKSDSEKVVIRKNMEDILAEAKSGKDFAELAKEYTEDPGSKNTGGLYEDFTRGRMVKPFEEAAFNVPIGEISDIIETQYGYHILKVINRKKDPQPLEKARIMIERELTGKKRNRVTRAHIQKLKDEVEFTLISY